MLVRRSNENLYRKTIIYKTQTTNQDSSEEEEIQIEENFQNEQVFFFMNVKRLPIHIFSFFTRQIDSSKNLGANVCPPIGGLPCNTDTHIYTHAQPTQGPTD